MTGICLVEREREIERERAVRPQLAMAVNWLYVIQELWVAYVDIFVSRSDWGSLILVDERFAKNPKKYTTGRKDDVHFVLV